MQLEPGCVSKDQTEEMGGRAMGRSGTICFLDLELPATLPSGHPGRTPLPTVGPALCRAQWAGGGRGERWLRGAASVVFDLKALFLQQDMKEVRSHRSRKSLSLCLATRGNV